MNNIDDLSLDLVLTEDGLESLVLNDYNQILGKEILCTSVHCYVGVDCIEISFPQPLKFKVTETVESDLFHWNDEWIDPYWNVEPIDNIPEVGEEKPRSFWVYGVSYNINGQVEFSSEWEIENE